MQSFCVLLVLCSHDDPVGHHGLLFAHSFMSISPFRVSLEELSSSLWSSASNKYIYNGFQQVTSLSLLSFDSTKADTHEIDVHMWSCCCLVSNTSVSLSSPLNTPPPSLDVLHMLLCSFCLCDVLLHCYANECK